MSEGLFKKFPTSREANALLAELEQQGLTPDEARHAITATANGALYAAQGGGGGLGAWLTGTAAGITPQGGPAQTVDPIVNTVAKKAKLSPDKARKAVNIVLPRLIAYVKANGA